MYYVNKSHCLTLHKRYLTPLWKSIVKQANTHFIKTT